MPTTEHQISIERSHSSSHKIKVETDGTPAIKEYQAYKLVIKNVDIWISQKRYRPCLNMLFLISKKYIK